jgi:peptidoglycan/xylan/chitin deacetylase (PgdA/CDA1 family)
MQRPTGSIGLCLVLISCLVGFSIAGPPVSRRNHEKELEPVLRPNELGKLLILEYHRIGLENSAWSRSPQDFRQDLELLYSSGYRTVAMSDYVNGQINIGAGAHPVILTFDDSSPGQFRYLIQNGKKEIDPDCAVGILLDFKRRHPDFGAKATFFVLPGADEPNKLFGQPGYETEKLAKLAQLGFEIGNHTLWHANLKKYEAGMVRKQIALAVQAIQSAVPGYKTQALALPFGLYPKDIAWAVEGSYGNISYRNTAILKVSGGPAYSPYNSHWDPLHLPRIQVSGKSLEQLIHYYKTHPDDIFTSDGRAGTAAFPAGRESEFDPSRFKSVSARVY